MKTTKTTEHTNTPKTHTNGAQFQVLARVTYLEKESKPEASYFFFSYKIQIKNNSPNPVQLMSRHWVITDGDGQVEEVRGAGVVGLQPKIEPGQTFEYESACPLPTASGIKGTYQLIAEGGNHFEIQIPEFYLIAPSALH